MDVIEHRRALHRIPELDRELPETMAYLRKVLAPLGCTLSTPIPGALCAFFDFGRQDAIAFRSDADALPIQENTGLPFSSLHPGRMHACGHDGHMAMLLELAAWLDRQSTLPHNVLLVFQPAEETMDGAKDVCESGVFEIHRVRCVFGLHLWPELPAGVIATRKNVLMTSSCRVSVTVTGRSCHIARPWEGIDALAAGVRFFQRAEELAASFPEDTYRLLKFGRMESGTVPNAVSGETVLQGSIRVYETSVFQAIQEGLSRIARELEGETGCTVTLSYSGGNPAVTNPPELVDQVRACGLRFETLEAPVAISEDFSWYQQRLPGLFFLLGIGPSPALHADTFHFDESVLSTGAAFWQRLAARFQYGS